MTALRAEGLTRRFASGEGCVEVLRGLDLELEAGASLAITGASGSGKSTLLNILGGLDRADEGRVLIADQPLGELDDAGLAELRNRRVGFVFQLHHLLPQCSALENALIPRLIVPERDPAADEARARELLTRVGLAARVDHKPAALSGGERQRVALVRALINAPAVLLADEPTGALDRASSDGLMALLQELREREGLAVVMVTHDLRLASRLDRQLVLSEGRLQPSGAGA